MPSSPLIQFNWKFLSASLALALLVFIALYIRDRLISPLLGDSLAVIWLYMTLRAFIKLKTVTAASLTLALAFAVELAQYLNVLGLLGLQHIRPLRITLGSTFDPLDLAAYSLGWALVITVHILRKRGQLPPKA